MDSIITGNKFITIIFKGMSMAIPAINMPRGIVIIPESMPLAK